MEDGASQRSKNSDADLTLLAATNATSKVVMGSGGGGKPLALRMLDRVTAARTDLLTKLVRASDRHGLGMLEVRFPVSRRTTPDCTQKVMILPNAVLVSLR